MTTIDFSRLRDMVSQDAAFRRRQRLQPIGGKGDKIFPPTYPGERNNSPPRHVYERRKLSDQKEAWCVLVDSVQSQANRLEEILLATIESSEAVVPHIVVDFAGKQLEGITRITSLDAPHRVYDAILRDSQLDGKPFMQSPVGERLAKARPAEASAVLEISPTALLFGAWHSTGEGGGLGAKFARSLVSEIVAIDVPVEEVVNTRTGEVDVHTASRRTGSRIDPLGVLSKVQVYKGSEGWDTSKDGVGKNAKAVKPSEINHGNIKPSISVLGITCDHIEHTAVISFASLRRLRFGSAEKDAAGRAYLAALGLLALTGQDSRGYALRSRCDLVCDGRAPLELVRPDGLTEEFVLAYAEALKLYKEAFKQAQSAGFDLPAAPLRLTPQDKLVAIVRESQRLALAGEGGESAGEAA